MVQAVRLISFSIDDGPARAGICDGELVRDTGLSMRELLACGARTVRPVAEHPRSGIRPLPAVPDPGKIMCIGRNYREHAAEQGAEAPEAPLVFAKYSSALITEGDAIRLPAISDSVDWEAELVAVVGRRCKDVPESDAWGVIAAYTVMNDVSARDLQRGDGQPIAGLALDAVLDGRGQEARGDSDDHQQGKDDDDGADCGACEFQCFHVDVPGQTASCMPCVPFRRAVKLSLSRKMGERSKGVHK